MNKYIYILLLPLFIACSSDDEYTPTTEPNKGDNITVQDIVGTYEPSRVYFDNSTDVGFFEHKQKLTFNSDNTGYDFTYNGDHTPFIWSISNNVILFKHSKYGNVKAWIKDGKLSFRAIYSISIAVFEYKKIK